MTNYIEILTSQKKIKALISCMQSIVLPGFQGASFYSVFRLLIIELNKESITVKATSLAFNALLAIFPAIIFFVTLIPYVPIAGFQEHLLTLMMEVLPYNAYKAIENTLLDILTRYNDSLLSVSCLSSIVFATNGVNTLMNIFNNDLFLSEKRSFIKQWIVAFSLTIYLIISIIFAISLLAGGAYLITWLESKFDLRNIFVMCFYTLKWLIIFMLQFLAVCVLYYYGAASSRSKNFISPGAIFSAIMQVILSLIFAYYINNFSTYNTLYGSIGTLIVVMLWLEINSLVILFGYELNSSIELAVRNKAIQEDIKE